MPTRHHLESMRRALPLVSPGTALRDGLDRIVQSKMGALVVVGDGPAVLAICSGGFLLEAEFSPPRLHELAKMDGAIILSGDATRIARANVHLVPDPSVPTSETGTRHRTGERVARSVDVLVISISEEMGLISVYVGEDKHTLQPVGRLYDRATQALQTLERYRARLDDVSAELASHELDDIVTTRDVAIVLQRSEMMRRIAEEIDRAVIELGDEGRLIALQRFELIAGVDRGATLVLRDYLPGTWGDAGRGALARLDTDELLDLDAVARAYGLGVTVRPSDSVMDHHEGTRAGASGSSPIRPRGYRLLHRVPRLSEAVINHVVDHFGSLPAVMSATVSDLVEVDGVGEVRARAIRDGLARAVEAIRADTVRR